MKNSLQAAHKGGPLAERVACLFIPCLAEDCMRLDADPLDGVNDHQGSITESSCGRDFRTEIDMPGGIYQVHQNTWKRDSRSRMLVTRIQLI